MNSGRIVDAIEVFRLNAEVFAQSPDVYESLAEAYMKSGDFQNAVANYRKSLELNPENNNAKEMLQKLQKG